jgi:hypothetical protein
VPNALRDLPKFLVLNPVSTVRVRIQLAAPSCEIDVELNNPRPGRSFVLLIGRAGGPYVQRVRLAGRARIFFDPQSPGVYELLLANPQADAVVLRLRGREVGAAPKVRVAPAPASPRKRAKKTATSPPRPRRGAGHRARSTART